MAKYVKRTSAPSLTDKRFIHYSKGGYNICKIIDKKTGYVLPNCVGYAHGRLLEILGQSKVNWKIPACNAEDWYTQAKKNGMSVGATPKLGSVIVWSKGKLQNAADGAGHIAVVEAISADGSIVISESGYNAYMFKTETVKKPYNRSGYKLEGFVYCGLEFESDKPKYVVGKTYTCQAEMKVRTGAGVNYSAKKHTQLTTDGQKHDKDKDGCLDKGTVVTCLESKVVGNDVWVRTPSGWVAGYYNNTQYLK